MDFLTPELIRQLVLQMPVAGAELLAAWFFFKKSEQRCEERYKQVFSELMRIKEQIK